MVLQAYASKSGYPANTITPPIVEHDGGLVRQADEDSMTWAPSFHTPVTQEPFTADQIYRDGHDSPPQINPGANVGHLIDSALKDGPVIVHMWISTRQYTGPHYVVITGGDSSHGYTINDPEGLSTTLESPNHGYSLSAVEQVVVVRPSK